MSRLVELAAQGFDRSEPGEHDGHIRVRCSSCAPSVVNGTPIHERGCPNERHECRGCNTLVPMNQRYCEDCQ